LEFSTVRPKLMLPKRTFWEKATAAHAYCASGDVGDRHSRHWHDLVRLDKAGYAKEAFADRALAKDVAEFKSRFFRGRDRAGNPIDYSVAVAGKLQLVPDADVMKVLEADYRKMADEGILLDEAEPFAELMRRCAELQKRANEGF
jgi:nucleotidyltransferase AbiEii toxin of type IV toxin-antitoxin system